MTAGNTLGLGRSSEAVRGNSGSFPLDAMRSQLFPLGKCSSAFFYNVNNITGFWFCLSNLNENMIKLHIRSCFFTSAKALQAVGVQLFSVHLRPSCHYLWILQSPKSCVSLR